MGSRAQAEENHRSDGALTILAAEGARHRQALLLQFIKRIGHRAVSAATAADAIKAAGAPAPSRPDLVIADLQIAAESPETFVSSIKSAAGERTPILLIAGEAEENLLIRALEAGAEDYIPRPIRFSLLAARLRGLARTLQLNRELEARNIELAAYRATEEEESHVARHVISKLIREDLLNDPVLSHWVRPAGTYFSGDMVLAARTPSGDLHVLLADAAGHGLSAALNALPVTQPFYAMTEKGFSIDRIVCEINRKIRDLLPIERFVAASAVSVNFREQIISVWNGGCPPVLVVGEDGGVLHAAFSRQLPLGVADERLFSRGLEVFRYEQRCQIVACSDGMVEIAEPGGGMLGSDGLAVLLSGEPSVNRMAVLKSAVGVILGGTNAADDISVLMVDCQPAATQLAAVTDPADVPRIRNATGEWRLGLSLSAEELKYVDVVPLLLNIVQATACGKWHGSQVFVILSELFNNALDHGLLGLDSRIKLEEDGFAKYLNLRAQGLQKLVEASITIEIEVERSGASPMLRIAVKDTGNGFDHARIIEAMPDAAQPFGRGIATVRRLCNRIRYRGCGNEVVVHYPLDLPAEDDAVRSGQHPAILAA